MIVFTTTEREILAHRLGVPDALADCLSDDDGGDGGQVFDYDQVHARADELRLTFERGDDYDLATATPLDRGILFDCVSGSTWNLANETASEVALGSVTRGQVLAWHKAQRSIERKMAAVGMRVFFPAE